MAMLPSFAHPNASYYSYSNHATTGVPDTRYIIVLILHYKQYVLLLLSGGKWFLFFFFLYVDNLFRHSPPPPPLSHLARPRFLLTAFAY